MILNTIRNLISLTCIKTTHQGSQQTHILVLPKSPEILRFSKNKKTPTGDLNMQARFAWIRFSFKLSKKDFPKAWKLKNIKDIRPKEIKILTCDIVQKEGKEGIYSVEKNYIFEKFPKSTPGKKIKTEYVSPENENINTDVYIKPTSIINPLLESLIKNKSRCFKLNLTFNKPNSEPKKKIQKIFETPLFRMVGLEKSIKFEVVDQDMSETMKRTTNNKQTETDLQTIMDTDIQKRQVEPFPRSSHIDQKIAQPDNGFQAPIISQPENLQPNDTEAEQPYINGVNQHAISNQQPPNDTEKNGISDRIDSPILESHRQPSHIVKKIAQPVNDLKAPIIFQPKNPQPNDTEAEHLYSIGVNQETITNQQPSNDTEKNGFSERIESSVLELHGQPSVNLYSKDDEKQEELLETFTIKGLEKYISEGSIKVDEKQSEFSQVIDIDSSAEQVQCFKEEHPEETGEDYDKWLFEEKHQKSANFSSKEETPSVSKHESLRNTRVTKNYSFFKTLIFWLLVTIFILLIISLVYCLMRKKLLNRR
ncbi:hypothetical protein CDIK_3375 [Cucumispora dikerogammari]|nr:hypothetical protein CDIK_3375 [Cucumispora dikerogammari]